jgi:hypothetical protein
LAIIFVALFSSNVDKGVGCVCNPTQTFIPTFNPTINIEHSADKNKDATESEIEDDASFKASKDNKGNEKNRD